MAIRARANVIIQTVRTVVTAVIQKLITISQALQGSRRCRTRGVLTTHPRRLICHHLARGLLMPLRLTARLAKALQHLAPLHHLTSTLHRHLSHLALLPAHLRLTLPHLATSPPHLAQALYLATPHLTIITATMANKSCRLM
jgi:hypothetical protein